MNNSTKLEDNASGTQTAARPAAASDVLRDCDPDDTAGNIDRLTATGWDALAAQQEAVLHREMHKRRARGPAGAATKRRVKPDPDSGKVDGSAFLAKRADLTALLRDGVPEPTYLPSPALGERLFYEGQTFLFSGHKKAGKSWAMIVQAYDCMRAGRPVVYVDNENGHELFAERLLMLGCTQQEAAEHLYYVPFPARIAKPSDLRGEFAAIAAALPGAFIVLDSLRTFMAKLGLNPNVDVEVEQFLGPIMGAVKLAPERPTVGVIDHANRKGTASDEFVAAGSFAKPAAVDGAYFFTKLEPFTRDQAGTVQITVKDDRRGRLDFERFYRVGGQGDGPFRIEPVEKQATGAGGRVLADVEQVVADADGPLAKSKVRSRVRGDNTIIDRALDALAADPSCPVVTCQEGKKPPKYVWDEQAKQGGGLDV